MNKFKNIIEERKRIIRKLDKEYDQLWAAKRNLGYITLDKPLRHGWYKHLDLREDVAKRKDAHIFEEILKVAGHKVWGRDVKHLEKVWKKHKKKNRNWQYPGLFWVFKEDFDKLSPKAKKWFEGYDWSWSKYRRGSVKRYRCKVPPYFFRFVYTKAFIVKRKIIDPTIEQRMDEIEEKFYNQELYRLSRYGWKYKWKNYNYHKRCRRLTRVALQNYDEDKYDKMVYRRLDW